MKPIKIAARGYHPNSPSYSGGSLDTQTVTTGLSGTIAAGNRIRGYVKGSIGGISTGNSALYAGTAINDIASVEQGVGGGFDVIFQVAGNVANTGWTSMNVGGSHVLNRASATYTTGGGTTQWEWAGAGQLFSGTVVVGFN